MQLIDEQNNLSLAVLHLIEDCFQALLKFAPILCTGNQCAHIQGENGLVLQILGYVAADNPLGKSLGNGGFTNAGLTDQNRVVFGLSGQNADNIPDFLISADDRVHLLISCLLHQIGAVFVQRIISALWIVGGHTGAAANLFQGFQAAFAGDVVGVKELFHAAVCLSNQTQQNMLHGHIFIPHAFGNVLRLHKGSVYVTVDIDLARFSAGPGYRRQPRHLILRRSGNGLSGDAHFRQQLGHQTAVLHHQSQQHMALLNLLVVVFLCNILGKLYGFHRFLRQLLYIHKTSSFPGNRILALLGFEC